MPDTLLESNTAEVQPTPSTVQDQPATQQANAQANAQDPSTTQQTPTQDVAPTWPENWRELKANGDEKMLRRLQRYASPSAAIDALFAAQAKISSGELKSALKPNATPEEKSAWREENGIPQEANGYEINLPNGLVIGASDRPVVDDFLKSAHEANMHPSQVNQALAWYFDKQEQAVAEQSARDHETRMHAEDELRAEFGPEYRRNVQIANQLLDGAPEGVKDRLLAGRMADGTPIGNDPSVIRWLVGLSRELNPIATVVPGSGTNAVQAMETEIADLRTKMGDHKSEYWRGPKAQQLQARYRDLVNAQAKAR